ncbi:MAG: hypothetical protein U0892_05570 [Pirellulales bacterium]
MTIPPGEESGASFQLKEVEEGRLKLDLEVQDDFVLDNSAYAGLDPPRQLQVVLVTPGNSALETALSTSQATTVAGLSIISPETLETPEGKKMAEGGKVDLFIYDRCSPPAMPASNTLFIGAVPPGDAWKATGPVSPVFIIDTKRSHPILQYVDMGSVRIVEGSVLQMPPGGTELMRSESGVLMGVAPREAYQDAVLGMPLVQKGEQGEEPNTDWPRKRSFPVFLLNCLEYLGGAVSTSGSKTVLPGESAVLSLASRHEKVNVKLPGGETKQLDRAGQPQLIYSQTEQPGFYSVTPTDSDRLLQLFTVNLFTERESDLAIKPELMLGDQPIAADSAQQPTRREFWRWLLLFALCVLTLEWIMYTRRVAV